jgi:2-methylcitrate dehydratase PrpD
VSRPLTAELGAFIERMQAVALPATVVEIARQGYTDCIGVMLAGSREPVTAAVESVLSMDAAAGPATLYFSRKGLPAPAAAWINGTAAHALDYDDVALKGSHPSAVLVPAILAEAQVLEASGREVVAAYVAGYEVWADLISRERGNYQRKGWHPTGVFGAISAAAACAVLHRLDAVASAHALGVAASQSSGIMSNLGSMVKPTHPGKAAACGILAARFAKAGVTAAADCLEHEQGFLKAISPAGEVDLERPLACASGWQILEHGLAIKQYPVCYRAHRAIDAVLALKRSAAFNPADIAGIEVSFSKSHAVILKNHRPATATEAKFSIEFALACAIAMERVGLRDLTDEVVRGDEIQRLIHLVTIEINPVEEAGTSGYSPYDSVRIRMRDGSVLESERIAHAFGDPRAPLTLQQRWQKFEDCAAWSGVEVDAQGLFDILQRLESCQSVAELFAAGSVGNPIEAGRRKAG